MTMFALQLKGKETLETYATRVVAEIKSAEKAARDGTADAAFRRLDLIHDLANHPAVTRINDPDARAKLTKDALLKAYIASGMKEVSARTRVSEAVAMTKAADNWADIKKRINEAREKGAAAPKNGWGTVALAAVRAAANGTLDEEAWSRLFKDGRATPAKQPTAAETALSAYNALVKAAEALRKSQAEFSPAALASLGDAMNDLAIDAKALRSKVKSAREAAKTGESGATETTKATETKGESEATETKGETTAANPLEELSALMAANPAALKALAAILGGK